MAATPSGGTITIPEAEAKHRWSTVDEVDQAITELTKVKDAWVETDLPTRISLLEDIVSLAVEHMDEWAEVSMPPKGIDPGSALAGEDYATGPMQLVRHARLLADTLRMLHETGDVQLPAEPYVKHGQVVVPVFPTSKLDQAAMPMHKAELWLEPHVTLDTIETAAIYKDKDHPGKLCCVLGAGNFSSIGAKDVLHKMFADDEVCILKMNPVNEHVGPVLEKVHEPLVHAGFLRIVYGGIEVGSHLTSHPEVDTLHMTGSDKTYEAIVFGPGKEGAKRKAKDQPVNTKPFTTELGSVGPVIVTPGPWSDADIEYQAKQLVSWLSLNVGFACGCPRVIITHKRWAKRQQFLDAIRACLAEAPEREPYYPGARDRWEAFMAAHPEAETFGPTDEGCVPWTFIPDLDPDERDDIAFRVEAWQGLFAEVALDVDADVAAFLFHATEFANEALWGTLSATMLVHPKQLKDVEIEAAVDRAVRDLRYGSIGINVWAAVSYGMGSTTWGGFPGHTRTDIQSGQGVVNNTYLIGSPQKTVVQAPWMLGKKPPMSYDAKTFPAMARKLTLLEGNADWKQLPGIVIDGLRA